MNLKTAIFRCDGGPNIGNGHVLRTLVLAKNLKKNNIKCFFLIKKCNSFLKKLIKKNFNFIFLKRDRYDEIKKIIIRLNCYYFIIDHYNFPFRLEKKISYIVNKIIVIEDYPKKKHFADLIIDQNFYREKKDYRITKNKKCKILLGEKYSLLDTKLEKACKRIENKKTKISNILICFGGFDRYKLNLKYLKLLNNLKKKINFHILISRKDNYSIEIKKYIKNNKINAFIYINLTLLDLIKKIDFAIISGGTIAKEIIAINIPSIIISTSTDQLNNCKKYKKLKKIKYLGHWNKVKIEKFMNCINGIFKQEKEILGKKEAKIFDFKGASRVTNEILKI